MRRTLYLLNVIRIMMKSVYLVESGGAECNIKEEISRWRLWIRNGNQGRNGTEKKEEEK